ncbi:MAG TPA: hypothetical protein VKT27_00830 [Candidatus Binataceae bacterium]|nr:hypothetical protein [Candidatus Binataceae bacterium]
MRSDFYGVRKGLVGILALLELSGLAPTASAIAGSPLKGSGSYTLVSAAFTYDGSAAAILLTGSGQDNLGGSFTFQCVAELSPTATVCTAPDSTTGTRFDQVQSDCASNYHRGQLYLFAGAGKGSQCISNTTGSAGGSADYTVTGGTRKLAGASGSFNVSFTSQTLAAPGTPPGANGLFGAGQFSESGAVSK